MPYIFNLKYFSEIGIQFVRDGSYDFEFIGMADFINKKVITLLSGKWNTSVGLAQKLYKILKLLCMQMKE